MSPVDLPAPIGRRDVLKLAGGALASALPAGRARGQSRTSKRVVVAGAGISGLCCAYELMRRGHEVTLLEAAGRPGGHILTVRDPLAGGLYIDAGAEHFYKPGYDQLWRYLDEFDLPVIAYPRREHMIHFLRGKMYTEEMLSDRVVLQKLELNQRETGYLARHAWPEFSGLYLAPYLDRFADEYRPFDAGLDHLDELTMREFLAKEGASAAAIGFLGGSRSALQTVWHAAIKKRRGFPQYVRRVQRIRGGNQSLTDAFAAKLGPRLRLGAPLTAIEHGSSGVTVEYRGFGRKQKLDADALVISMPLTALRAIPITPDWPEAKRYIIDNQTYDLKARTVFQSRTAFWTTDGLSPNMAFGEPALSGVWRMAEEVRTSRAVLIGTTIGASAEQALAAFRKLYPGKSEDIEQSFLVDWTRDPWAAACLPLSYPPGRLAKYWPEVMQPHGRIHFASVVADNLPFGMEAGVRAARRVAEAIGQG